MNKRLENPSIPAHDQAETGIDDRELVERARTGDEDAFHTAFEELLQVVRTEGEELEDEDLDASDVILPPSDLSFVEAGEEFTGDGLIPEPA